MLIYELYIDKFARNIKGLITKLDYLRDLGMNAIWLLPHYPSPMVDDGYDVTDYKGIRGELGTFEDFKKLTEISHEKGLKIIIDLPINHTSTEHKWFAEARASLDNPKRNYYLWSKSGADMLTAVNAFPNAKLTNWIYNPFTKDYYFATFYPLQPDLNWDNPQVIEEFFEILDFWIDMGVDGFRLDAVTHIIKRKHSLSVALPETHNIVNAIRKHLLSKQKDIMLIGEADLPTLHAADYFGSSRDGCTALINFEDSLNMWLNFFEKDENLIKQQQNHTSYTADKGDWIYFLGMHDAMPLYVMHADLQQRLKQKLDPENKFESKHDKRIALRIAEILNGNQEQIINLYKQLMNQNGHKIIYYGDEIGMRNSKTDEFLIDNRHEIRNDFDWNEQKRQAEDPKSLLNGLKRLFVAQRV
ncbi:hypothetical protein GYA27_00280 [candidate division WWE3 bacterium]|uniref:Glycosyl hydrolase family 13 catalytic domain-containing protein n=1 Tax=candidate division WWE3 bacterium TaxID=2053526 RepID=A0A7X9DJI2_UNCKA|nr:hypothetical protein [candidate division WWE3 bacterium]